VPVKVSISAQPVFIIVGSEAVCADKANLSERSPESASYRTRRAKRQHGLHLQLS